MVALTVIFEPSPPLTGALYCPTCEKHFHPSEAASQRCPSDNTKLVQLAPSIDNLIGRELDGRYTILERLGAGGMGTVYRADQHSMGREVAVKVLNNTHVSDPFAIKRFLREAKLASRLNHPNAVAVLDFGQTADGLSFLVMELVDGRTLEAVFRDEGRFPPERLIRIAIQVCDALERAHELKIVHRDLKPSNIMVLRTGRDLVKVLDFGLAKSLSVDSVVSNMSYSGELLGTPAFMPPEIANGQDCDQRSDLYSLGMTLYFLAVGSMPFHGRSVHEWLYHHMETPPPTPLVPEPLRGIILRMIAKQPGDRYATAADARADLDEALLQLRERRFPTPVPVAGSHHSPSVPPASADPVAEAASGPRGRVGRAPPRQTDVRKLELGHTIAARMEPTLGNDDVPPSIAKAPEPTAVAEPALSIAGSTLQSRDRGRRGWLAIAAISAVGIATATWLIAIRGEPRRQEALPGPSAAQPTLANQPAEAARSGAPGSATVPERLDATESLSPSEPKPTAAANAGGEASPEPTSRRDAGSGTAKSRVDSRDRRFGPKRNGTGGSSKPSNAELPF